MSKNNDYISIADLLIADMNGEYDEVAAPTGTELEWYSKGWDDALKNQAAEQEPVYIIGEGWQCDGDLKVGTRLYTNPTKRLSDEEILRVINGTAWIGTEEEIRVKVANAVIDKLMEINK